MLLVKIAIFLLWFGAVIDPIGNMFGIRYVALATAFAGLAWLFLLEGFKILDKSFRGIFILLLAALLPLYGLTLYSFRAGNAEFIDTSYIASGVLIITSLLYRSQAMCEFGVSSLVFSTRFLSLLIIAVFVSPFLSFYEWINFFTEKNVALISFREYSGITLPYIYFLASPLLILLMAYDFSKFKQRTSIVNLLVFALTAFSFALTGTRAHIIIAIIFAPLYMLLTGNSRTMIKASISLAFVTLFALTLEETRILLDSFFSTSEASNSIKVSLLDGYGEIFSNPLILLFGQGFNAHEWSLPLIDMIAMEASKTELTYLELIRVFGVFIAIAFMSVIFFLLRRTKSLGNDFGWIYPGFLILLTNAAINPYLFSVNGILPLGLISAIAYHYNRIDNRDATKS
jgi:hypothetical protein